MNWLPTHLAGQHVIGAIQTPGGERGKLFILISSCCCLETGVEVSCNWFVFILRCSGQKDWMWVIFGSCPLSQPHISLPPSVACLNLALPQILEKLWILASSGAWHGEKSHCMAHST